MSDGLGVCSRASRAVLLRIPRGRSCAVGGAALLFGSLLPALATSSPVGATTPNALVAVAPAPQTQPIGDAQADPAEPSCQGTEGSPCGPDLAHSLPLDTSTTPPMEDLSWGDPATGPQVGLTTSGSTVVSSELALASELAGWEMLPEPTGDVINEVAAPTPATSVDESTDGGGSASEGDGAIDVTIIVDCTAEASGALDLSAAGSAPEDLPAEPADIRSSSPDGGLDPIDGSVTSELSDVERSATPSFCAASADGSQLYTISWNALPDSPAVPLARSLVALRGKGSDGVRELALPSITIKIAGEPRPGPGSGRASILPSSLVPTARADIAAGTVLVADPMGPSTGGGSGRSLSSTGMNAVLLGGIAIVLIAAGIAIGVLRRRRSDRD